MTSRTGSAAKVKAFAKVIIYRVARSKLILSKQHEYETNNIKPCSMQKTISVIVFMTNVDEEVESHPCNLIPNNTAYAGFLEFQRVGNFMRMFRILES